jgi:hypothetical protein
MYHLADDVLPEILKTAFDIAAKNEGVRLYADLRSSSLTPSHAADIAALKRAES